jgi:Glycosyl hydrolases family 17
MAPIAAFLESKGYPLLVNIYPYFSYTANTKEVHLDYALFSMRQTTVLDGEVQYRNLFDAMVDSVYAALEKSGGPSVQVVVSETGWPSGGGAPGATLENARIYNNNVIAHVKRGTPRRPGKELETYLFAMFNENQKPEGLEQNFGLYRPDMTEVYHVDFS